MLNKKTLSLIEELSDKINISGGCSEKQLKVFEDSLKIVFPDDFRDYLLRFGRISAKGLGLFGFEKDPHHPRHINNLIQPLSKLSIDFPIGLIPLEDHGAGFLTCLNCSPSKKIEPLNDVAIWDFNSEEENKKISVIANSFNEFLFQKLYQVKYFELSYQCLRAHVKEFDENYYIHTKEDRNLPRNHIYRPYRFCIQDIVFGFVVICHERQTGRELVDVFLTATIPEYEPDTGVKALSLMILSDAFRCGGIMEIQFTPKVEGGRIPLELVQLAEKNGITFSKKEQGLIISKEAKQLYSILTGFSPEIANRIKNLDELGIISSPSIAYAINRGIWDRCEIEVMLQTHSNPGKFLNSIFYPEHRIPYWSDFLIGRNILMAGSFERQLKTRFHSIGQNEIHLEDDDRLIVRTIHSDSFSITYSTLEEDIQLTLLDRYDLELEATQKVIEINKNRPFTILYRGRDALDLQANLLNDLENFIKLQNKKVIGLLITMVPKDFLLLPVEFRKKISKFTKNKIELMVARDFTQTMDSEVIGKINMSRGLRS